MTDMLKTVYPPKTTFCGGYNYKFPQQIEFLSHWNKKQSFVPLIYRCYMWNVERIGLTALEENVYDGQTDD